VVFSVKITFKDGTTNEVTAKLKDRGTVMTQPPAPRPDDEDEVPPGLGDPVDEVEELHTTEHRPSLRHPVRRFTPDDIVNAINGR